MGQLKSLGTILLMTISLTTNGQRDVTGYYSSNAANIGFFITKIQLNSDSTFKYEMYGDLQYDKGTGKYRVEKGRTVYVTFDKDSLDILGIERMSTRPVKYFVRNNKMYQSKTDGKIQKRGQTFSRHKKYLFFGQRYMTTRKMYLKRGEGNLIWREEKNASR